LEEYIREKKNIPEYNFEANKNTLYDNSPLEVKWINIKEFFREKNNLRKSFKKTEWRTLFRDIANGAVGVNYKWR